MSAFALALPAQVIAALLGVATADLADTAQRIDDLVGGFAAGSGGERIARAQAAAEVLLARFDALAGGLVAAAQVTGAALDRRDAIANAIGFLSQAYEATAGLIGNSLVALGRGHAVDNDVVAYVLRDDPPVQNTRRFVVRAGAIAGRELAAGDAILVVLAAASRDAARTGPRWAFGAGAHACPGSSLAVAIARAGVHQLLAAGVDPARLLRSLAYRPSVSTRVPTFGAAV